MSVLPKKPEKDWTHLLTDPAGGHIGVLLQAYREAAPDQREEALLAAMRKIRKGAGAPATSKQRRQPRLRAASAATKSFLPAHRPRGGD